MHSPWACGFGPFFGLPGSAVVVRVWSVMVGWSMYVFVIEISVAPGGLRFNPSWHLTGGAVVDFLFIVFSFHSQRPRRSLSLGRYCDMRSRLSLLGMALFGLTKSCFS